MLGQRWRKNKRANHKGHKTTENVVCGVFSACKQYPKLQYWTGQDRIEVFVVRKYRWRRDFSEPTFEPIPQSLIQFPSPTM